MKTTCLFFVASKNPPPNETKKRRSGPGRDAYASLAGGYRSKMEDGRDPAAAGSWWDFFSGCWWCVLHIVALVKNSFQDLQ